MATSYLVRFTEQARESGVVRCVHSSVGDSRVVRLVSTPTEKQATERKTALEGIGISHYLNIGKAIEIF
jgi:hypothetical protein